MESNRLYPEGVAFDEAWRQRQRADKAEAECARLGRCNEQISLSHAEVVNSQNAKLAAAVVLLREAVKCNRLTLPDDWWQRAKEVCGG